MINEDLKSWTIALVILFFLTFSLKLYQEYYGQILQPLFFFFIFQIPSLLGLFILIYFLLKKYKEARIRVFQIS